MTPAWVVKQIETWRREHKWSAQRISDELADSGFRIDRRTVTRHLTRLGLGRRRFIDPGGDNNRNPGKIVARWPGHMVHLDVKKVGRIPDGGGWRIHGRDSDQTKTVSRAKAAGAKRGYTYLHSAVDGFSRLAYTEPLSDEKGATAAAFLARAKVWFAAHGITHIHRVVTDNGACYRSGDFAWIVGKSTRHQKTKPYTPQHNGKVERYQRILAEELLYARNFNSEEDRSSAISVWNIHYNYHRRHSGAGGWPPASRVREGVTNVQPSYTYQAMLLEEGQRATTLEAVAARAGVSKGGLLYHFKSKEALAEGLIERLEALMAEDLEAMRSADDGPSRYYVRTSVWTDSALDRALVAVSQLAQESHPEARATMARARDAWLALIREEVDSPAIAHAILLIGDGLYFDAALTGGSLSTEVAQVAVDELLPVVDHLLELGRG